MKNLKINEYFSLEETVILALGIEHGIPYDDIKWTDYPLTACLNDALGTIPLQLRDVNVQEVRCKEDLEKLFELIYARYYKHYCYYSEENNHEENNKNYVNFFVKLSNMMIFTYDKYHSLLEFYASNLSNLMGGIKVSTSGQIRFNDTPQDITAVSLDQFASNVTKSTTDSESMGSTPVDRLLEIKQKFISVYFDWVNEFDKMFLEEDSI